MLDDKLHGTQIGQERVVDHDQDEQLGPSCLQRLDCFQLPKFHLSFMKNLTPAIIGEVATHTQVAQNCVWLTGPPLMIQTCWVKMAASLPDPFSLEESGDMLHAILKGGFSSVQELLCERLKAKRTTTRKSLL